MGTTMKMTFISVTRSSLSSDWNNNIRIYLLPLSIHYYAQALMLLDTILDATTFNAFYTHTSSSPVFIPMNKF